MGFMMYPARPHPTVCHLDSNRLWLHHGRTKRSGMKKKTNNQLGVYRVNPVNNRLIIEIALNNYMEFFHEWDNAIFRKRDIHPELVDFLDLCSAEIPLGKQFEIEFCINSRAEDLEKEKLIKASYRNYYDSQNRLILRAIQRLLRYSLILSLIALGLMVFNVILNSHPQTQVFTIILSEGVHIGSWVFMWEAFHTMFMQTLDPLKRRQEFSRFLKAEISFKMIGQILEPEESILNSKALG
jgi:uncharacterized protein YejL (UPF0352 family)